MRGWCAGLGLALLSTAGSPGEPGGHDLGRLFTTPAERAAVAEARIGAGALRLDGLVRGPAGVVGLWIGGRRVAVGDPLATGGRVVAVEGERVVVERAGRRGALRVGERLEVGR